MQYRVQLNLKCTLTLSIAVYFTKGYFSKLLKKDWIYNNISRCRDNAKHCDQRKVCFHFMRFLFDAFMSYWDIHIILHAMGVTEWDLSSKFDMHVCQRTVTSVSILNSWSTDNVYHIVKNIILINSVQYYKYLIEKKGSIFFESAFGTLQVLFKTFQVHLPAASTRKYRRVIPHPRVEFLTIATTCLGGEYLCFQSKDTNRLMRNIKITGRKIWWIDRF